MNEASWTVVTLYNDNLLSLEISCSHLQATGLEHTVHKHLQWSMESKLLYMLSSNVWAEIILTRHALQQPSWVASFNIEPLSPWMTKQTLSVRPLLPSQFGESHGVYVSQLSPPESTTPQHTCSWHFTTKEGTGIANLVTDMTNIIMVFVTIIHRDNNQVYCIYHSYRHGQREPASQWETERLTDWQMDIGGEGSTTVLTSASTA